MAYRDRRYQQAKDNPDETRDFSDDTYDDTEVPEDSPPPPPSSTTRRTADRPAKSDGRTQPREDPKESAAAEKNPADQYPHPSSLYQVPNPEGPRFDPTAAPPPRTQPTPRMFDPVGPGTSGLQPAKKRSSIQKFLPKRFFKKDKRSEKTALEEYYEKFREFQSFMLELSEIVLKYEPTFPLEQTEDYPVLLVNALQQILEKLDKKWREPKLDIKELQGLMDKTKWSYEVKKLEKRISDAMEDQNYRMDLTAEKLYKCMDENRELKGMVAKLQSIENDLRNFNYIPEEEKDVIALRGVCDQLQNEKDNLVHLLAFLQVESKNNEEVIAKLQKRVAKISIEQIGTCVDMVAEIKDRVNADLMKQVVEQIEHFENLLPEDLSDLTNKTIERLQKAFEGAKKDIDKLKEDSKKIHEQFINSVEINMEKETKLQHEIAKADFLDLSIREQEKMNRNALAQVSHQLLFTCREEPIMEKVTKQGFKTSSPQEIARQNRSDRSAWSDEWGSPEVTPGLPYARENILDRSAWSDEWGSPEVARRGSPGLPYANENILDVHSLSLEDSGSNPIIPSLILTPPSPMRSPDRFVSSTRSNLVGPGTPSLSLPQSRIAVDPLTQSMRSVSIGPLTQSLSQPQSRLGIDPSTQNISNVTNRVDIGRSFNIHTDHSGSSPYRQVTRVDSILSPQPGPSRMLDSPLHVQHRANVTPPGYKTPWISTQSRYGYTDPSFKILNLPPGRGFEMNTALKKQLKLMSPQREDPLLVNIDVDPKPLVQTESGEHFICDISLDVQQAGKKKLPPVSPVYTYGVTPLITPTTNRRHGLFTPPGIFKKRHYNFRRIEDKFDDSPGKYFLPHYLPHDGRSPVSHLSPVSLLSDRTISWERIPGLEDDRSPPPVIPGPSWAYPGYFSSPQTDSSLEEESFSPVIQGIIDPDSTDFSDNSFERTPPSQRSLSPMIQGHVDMSSSPSADGSFERTPPSQRSLSPVIQGHVDMSSSPSVDGSFERSASPLMNRSFARSPSPRLDGTFERSQSPVIQGYVDGGSSYSADGSFERSASPVMNRTFEQTPSPLINESFDRSSSPGFGVSFDPLNSVPPFRIDGRGHIDRISSPSTDGSFHRSVSPQINATFESPSPLGQVYRFNTTQGRGCLDMSSSTSTDGSFDRSVSPQMNVTFESPSPLGQVYRFNTTQGRGCLDMSSSPSTDGSFHRSASPQIDATFERSPSPAIDGSFNRSISPRPDRTFESSPSPLGQVYRFNTTQGRGYLDMSSSPSTDGSFHRSTSPRLNVTFERSPSPAIDGSFNRSISPRLDRTFESSPSPLGRLIRTSPLMYESVGSLSNSMSPRSFNSDMSSSYSGYDNPFNPNNSVMSQSVLSPHIDLNSSMPSRLGGVFSNVPSRLTRTI